ncbi:MAG: hypothetical protein V4510_08940 [bacterium]
MQVLALPTGIQKVAADSAILLLVGGLSILSLIILLVVLQNLFPERSQRPGRAARPGSRELRPIAGAPPPRRPARPTGKRRHMQSATHPPVDLALARVIEMNLGEPRLLRSVDHFTHLRLYGCASCTAGVRGLECSRERSGVELAFREVFGPRVAVREIACHGRGAPECDFEVDV